MNISQLCQIYHTVLSLAQQIAFTPLHLWQCSKVSSTKTGYCNWQDWFDCTKSKTSYLWDKSFSPFEDKPWLGIFLVCFFVNGSNFPCWRLWQTNSVQKKLESLWKCGTRWIFAAFYDNIELGTHWKIVAQWPFYNLQQIPNVSFL